MNFKNFAKKIGSFENQITKKHFKFYIKKSLFLHDRNWQG